MTETQIHLRVSDDLRKELEGYAETYGTSVAAAARILIKKGLEASEPLLKLHYSYQSGADHDA